MNVLKARGGILLLGALLAACNGGHGTLPVAPGSSATGQGARSAGGLVYGGNLLAGATYLGPAALKTVGFDVWPALRDGRGLIEYAAHASDPASTHYRHWLTATQIGERFGAPASDYAALVKYLNGYGIAVKSYPQRMMLRVRGPQSGVEQALGMKLGFYRKGTQTFLAPQSAPNVPAGFHVAGFTALVGYRFQTRDYVPVRAASGILQGYAPQQLANAFDYVGAYQAAGHYTGSGITIGIIGTGPITDGDPRIGLGDVAEYRAIFGVSGSGAVTQVYDLTSVSAGNPSVVGGQYSSGLATPPPVTNPASSACAAQGINGPASGTPTDYTTCNPEDVEAQLDTEQASALAPDANLRFYIAYNPNECFATGTYTPNPVTGPVTCPGIGGTPTQQLGIALADDEIQSAIADGSADIVSLS
ncbi:MAG TPA: protease pro-enzyme activation domain-containing protein, partial [Candidatus Baltobacteraceae bacterium]|nr:protease pro-enzyme activation domain-containing protein [Candidatus Baltobacteraceae bacterium]